MKNTSQLRQKIAALHEQSAQATRNDPELAAQKALSLSAPGAGPVVASSLAADLPEPGRIDRCRIAALAGLAMFALPCPRAVNGMAMFARILTLAGGIIGAAGLSQFPEFSQQYAQRLGGAVDELSRVVSEFDADAAKLGMTRHQALNDLAGGSAMGSQRSATMARTVSRHARLSADLAAIEGAGPFTRALRVTHLTDREIAERVWQAYKPAIPVTFEGAVFAGVGFLTGMFLLGAVLSILRLPVRRRAYYRR